MAIYSWPSGSVCLGKREPFKDHPNTHTFPTRLVNNNKAAWKALAPTVKLLVKIMCVAVICDGENYNDAALTVLGCSCVREPALVNIKQAVATRIFHYHHIPSYYLHTSDFSTLC